MKARILMALLISILPVRAQDTPDSVLDRLSKVRVFAFGGVGFAGVTSKGQADYRIIFRRPSALNDFQKLLAFGTPEARLYALAGIRAKDPKGFGKIAQSFRQSKEDVRTQSGCIVQGEQFAVVLKRIEAGDYAAFQ